MTRTSSSSTRNEEWTVDPEQFASKGRNTPFAGWKVKGRVKYTIVGGTVIYEAPESRPAAEGEQKGGIGMKTRRSVPSWVPTLFL